MTEIEDDIFCFCVQLLKARYVDGNLDLGSYQCWLFMILAHFSSIKYPELFPFSYLNSHLIFIYSYINFSSSNSERRSQNFIFIIYSQSQRFDMDNIQAKEESDESHSNTPINNTKSEYLFPSKRSTKVLIFVSIFLLFSFFIGSISSSERFHFEDKKQAQGVRQTEGSKGRLLKAEDQNIKRNKLFVFDEEDSERYLQYSKANQRKADRKRRQKRIKKQLQDNNILKDIKKNPYLDDQYSYITKQDLKRVKKWRYMVGQDFTRPSTFAEEQKQYYNQKYHIDKYQELPFCLIIPTFNNRPRKRAQRNIRSIVMQDYKNYHFTIIDDGSVDGTGQLIKNFLQGQEKVDKSRYSIITHTERIYSVASIRNASKNFCKEEDIIMVVDGDDQLLGRQVLKLFNSVFQEKGVWYMYTNFLGSIGKVGYSRPYHPDIIEKNQYRDYSFAVSHLRAYYNKLLLNIKEEDLKDENGKFFTSAGDMAIAIPCLEQSHRRIAYIPEMTYFYNFNTGLNVHKKRLNEQRQNNLKIRAKERYKPLDKLFG